MFNLFPVSVSVFVLRTHKSFRGYVWKHNTMEIKEGKKCFCRNGKKWKNERKNKNTHNLLPLSTDNTSWVLCKYMEFVQLWYAFVAFIREWDEGLLANKTWENIRSNKKNRNEKGKSLFVHIPTFLLKLLSFSGVLVNVVKETTLNIYCLSMQN